MSLTVIENKLIDSLPIQYKTFIEAKYKYPMICTMKPAIVEKQTKDIILKSFLAMGINSYEDKIITFLREKITELLTQKYNRYTMAEVALFIKNGIMGEYGTYQGQLSTINLPNLSYWIKRGIESKERENSIKEFNKKLNEANGIDNSRNLPPNPEMQKKIIDILKPYAESLKPEYKSEKPKKETVKSKRDIFIQSCINEHYNIWLKKPYKPKIETPKEVGIIVNNEVSGRFILFNGDVVNEMEYVKLRLQEFDSLIKDGKELEL